MKMTKIAFWRKVKENCGTTVLSPKNGCNGIDCDLCPFKSQEMCDLCYVEKNFKEALAYANKQIKIHESKSRKKVKIDLSPYMKKETARLKAEKKKPAVKTDVRDMKNVVKDETVKESLKVDPTPLDIAKMIRDNEYGCHKIVLCDKCPIEKIPCGNSSTTKENFDIRKKAIDTYISEHEKVEPVMPEPISIEELRKMMGVKDEYVYYFNRDEKAGRVNMKFVFEMRVVGKHIMMLCGTIVEAENYYKTLADAVRVAEEKWSKK